MMCLIWKEGYVCPTSVHSELHSLNCCFYQQNLFQTKQHCQVTVDSSYSPFIKVKYASAKSFCDDGLADTVYFDVGWYLSG